MWPFSRSTFLKMFSVFNKFHSDDCNTTNRNNDREKFPFKILYFGNIPRKYPQSSTGKFSPEIFFEMIDF